MKKILGLLTLTCGMNVFAVGGYPDIYLDKSKDLVIHGIVCGDDLNNLNGLKPAGVFTNTSSIEKGTYYYKSAFGEYSLTFNTTKNPNVMVQGLLQKGQTSKDQMVKKLCIVNDMEGLPSQLRKYLKKTNLKANNANWKQTMKNYELVIGKPAFGKGVF